MNRDLKIVIVDDSKMSYVTIKTMLKQVGFENITYFEYPLDYVQHLKKIGPDDIDIVFIDYEMPIMNGLKVLYYTKFKFKHIVCVMMTSSTDVKVKEKAIEYGVNEFMHKGIDFFEFKAKVNILANLREHYYETKKHQQELELILKYKDTQETLAVQKQLKIIEDKVSNHFYGKWIADSYFKPKDILSGDSYVTMKVSPHRFFISVVDGMGKGVSASLSSVLTVSFMSYAVKRALEFNDFKFDRIVADTCHYASSIMLDDEALSFAMLDVDIKKGKIRYLNMGLPPFYLLKNGEVVKIRPNNRPLVQKTTEYTIDTYEDGFEAFLIASDGLFESNLESGYPYFMRFKQQYQNFFLLSDLIKDFQTYVKEPDDDTTIIFIKKDNDSYKVLFDEDVLLTEENIQKELDNLDKILDLPPKTKDRAIFALNELLLNAYEHAVLKISKNKHEIIQKNQKIEYNADDKFAQLTILKSDRYAIVDLNDFGDGFDVSKVLKSEWFDKYHGRGVKMLKKLSDGIYYNSIGNRVRLYFKLK